MERERERSLEGERDARKYALVTRERKARGGKGKVNGGKGGGEERRREEERDERRRAKWKRERDGEWSRGRAWPQIGHQVVARRPREKDRLRVRRRACASRNRAHARTHTRACGQSGTRALLQVVATGAQEIAPLPVVNPGRNFAAAVHRRIICRGDRTTAFKQIRHVHRE